MKIRYYLLILIGFTLGISSCVPDMDLENPNAVTTSSYYQTESEMIAAVNGAYNILQRNGGWGRYMFYLINSRGDDWTFTYKATAGMEEVPPICNFTYTSSNRAVYECWDDMYIMQYAANLVLEKADDADMTDSIRNRVKGEAYFLRGLSLFYLGQLYGEEIPVKTATPKSTDDYYASSADPGVLYAQMISDFKTAAELLPVRSVMYADDSDVGRATKGAALGFLAKAYMNRPLYDQYSTDNSSEWQNAADILYEIIESKEYDLTDAFRDNHTEDNENNIESLFEVQFYNGSGSYNDYYGEDIAGTTDQSTWRQQEIGQKDGGNNSNWWNMMPLRKTFDEFETQADTFVDPRVYESLWCPGGAKYQLVSNGRWVYFYSMFDGGRNDVNYGVYFGCRKYCGDVQTSEWETGINDRLLRYSDVLLMYAECLVELDRESEAYTYINMVRDRANNQIASTEANSHLWYTTSRGGLSTVQELIAAAPTYNGITINTIRRAIKHERYVELFGEGKRFTDIMRWSYNPSDPDNSTVYSVLEDKGYVRGTHEYYPIPASEIATNPNIKQNRAN